MAGGGRERERGKSGMQICSAWPRNLASVVISDSSERQRTWGKKQGLGIRHVALG